MSEFLKQDQEDEQELAKILRQKSKELRVYENIERALRALNSLRQRHVDLEASFTGLTVKYSSLKEEVDKAEDFIAKANIDAANKLKYARDKAQEMINEATAKADDIVKSADSSAAAVVAKTAQELNEKISDAENRLSEMSQAIDGKQSDYDAVIRLREEKDSLVASNIEEGAKLEKIRRDLSAILNVQK